MVKKGGSTAAAAATFDYDEVKHTLVTTPLVRGGRAAADKRKSSKQAMRAEPVAATVAKKGEKENRGEEGVPPGKKAKVTAPGGKDDSQAQQKQQAQGEQQSSVRYPRLDYSKEVPANESLFTRADVPGDEKLVYLARRVMEADTRKVEEILFTTKYNHLSDEMNKFATLVEKRMVQALKEDAAQEEKDKKELARLQELRAKEEAACKELDEEAARLKLEIQTYEEMEQQLDAESKAGSALAKQRQAEAALEAQEAPYPSPLMKDMEALMAQGAGIKQQALAVVSELLTALEEKVPAVEEQLSAAQEKQKELTDTFQGAQFAGFPDVQQPHKAARGLAASATAAAAAAKGGKAKA